MSERPPLILLHGFLGSAADWGEQPHGVYALDLPGHGLQQAAIHDIETFDDAVGWLLAQIDALDISVFDVCGYSMGGRLAYGLVATAPLRVRRFVALGAAPYCVDPEQRRLLDAQRAKQLRHWGLNDFLAHWYAQPLFDSLRDTPEFAGILDRRARGDAHALAHAIERLGPAGQPDYRVPLRTTNRPGLLVAGARDERYVRVLRGLAEDAYALSFREIPRAGHAVLHENPNAVRAALDEFLG